MHLILKLLDKTDPTASLRHAAYLVVISSSVAWMTYALIKTPLITREWVAALVALLAAVTTGKIMGTDDTGGSK